MREKLKFNKHLKILFFSVCVIFLVVLGMNIFFVFSFLNASEKIDLRDYQPVEIQIFGVSETDISSSISAKISIKDLDGNECATIERSWNGSSLEIDFIGIQEGNRKYWFPKTIRAMEHGEEIEKDKGLDLKKYYFIENRCLLAGKNEAKQRELFKIARFAFSPLCITKYSFIDKKTVRLSSCKNFVPYGIFCDSEGKLFLSEI